MGSASEMSRGPDFGKDHALIHEAVVTGRKAGWGAAEWAKLAHDEPLMRKFYDVLSGLSEITPSNHFIDCDARPVTALPDRSVLQHKKMGLIRCNPKSWDLVHKRGRIDGKQLLEEFLPQKVMNGNVLDFLFENQHLIPEEWKKVNGSMAENAIFFLGTLYVHDETREICFRLLYWNAVKGWQMNVGWGNGDWPIGASVAIFR